jgi:hypothetical protein
MDTCFDPVPDWALPSAVTIWDIPKKTLVSFSRRRETARSVLRGSCCGLCVDHLRCGQHGLLLDRARPPRTTYACTWTSPDSLMCASFS